MEMFEYSSLAMPQKGYFMGSAAIVYVMRTVHGDIEVDFANPIFNS